MTQDPGLQPERTRLAWRRTLLALAVVAVLTARLALPRGFSGALLAVASVSIWGAAVAVIWQQGSGTDRGRSGGLAFPVTALASCGYAVIGTLLVLQGVW